MSTLGLALPFPTVLWDWVSRITTLGLDLQNYYIRLSSPVRLLWDWVSRTTTLSLALQNSYIRFSAQARHIQIDQGNDPNNRNEPWNGATNTNMTIALEIAMCPTVEIAMSPAIDAEVCPVLETEMDPATDVEVCPAIKAGKSPNIDAEVCPAIKSNR
jgi:hypothetical protein